MSTHLFTSDALRHLTLISFQNWLLPLLIILWSVQARSQTLDPTFSPGTGPNGPVYNTTLQADGRVLLGGFFTTVNGTTRNYLARLNADGSVDTGFSTNVNAPVNSIVVQADGKILIGGNFTTVNGATQNRIARLNADGSLDPGFNPGTGIDDAVQSVALQADSKILIGGFFTTVNGTPCGRIARLNANGTLDSEFNTGGGVNMSVYSLGVQADGKILIGGFFTTVNGVSHNNIARLKTDGSLDTGFGTDVNNQVRNIAIQADGKVLMGGTFTMVNSTTRNRIARLNTDGTLDTSFDPGAGANDQVRSVAIQTDGKILIGGDFTTVNNMARNRIARLNTSGALDIGFDPGTGLDNFVSSLVLNTDGKLLIGGAFSSYNGTARNRVAQILSSAPAFAITGASTVNCTETEPGQRQLIFQPTYAGQDNTPVSFSVVNEMLPTTQPGPYSLRVYTDNPVITLSATQSGNTSTFAYNWLATCQANARQGVRPEVPLVVTVLANPVVGETVSLEVRGAEGQPLQLRLTDAQGHPIAERVLPQSAALERQTLRIGQSAAGMLLLQVSTPTQRQTLKLLRTN